MRVLGLLSLAMAVCCISAKVPSIKLYTGYEMPQIGLGTWQAKGDSVRQAVKDALEIGYRHIDTAFIYGNEKEVGEGIHQQIQKGVLKREDLFITTKVWPDGCNRQKALEMIKHSLKELNVTYLDLVLVHFPHDDYANTYQGLEDAYNQKLVRSIGISNFMKSHIDHVLKTAKVKPAVNQINIHPTLNQDETVAYCNKLGIAVTGYSPLGTGSMIKDPTLTSIGAKHHKSSAQVAIRWQIERNLITIPKSVNKKYIKEDFEVFDFKLTADEIKTINNMKA
ncbi:9,11-endoperoxide prostaglandin H2 reductase-like [Oppia nitens]|uniref:9,11-endoperoxide prostaglandin H2 reductase-like n=1 Tax=Oppia nitens TaxID=1686743 RepID=UPI0023DB59C5|nr:9,11-endoperoxide prostaglandin H2 reductase-like [Oppia nitens]